jgi:hypothetical protein
MLAKGLARRRCKVTAQRVDTRVPQEWASVKETAGGDTRIDERAAQIFSERSTSDPLRELMTRTRYEALP